MKSRIQFPALMFGLLFQAFAGANVENGYAKEGQGRENEDDVEHGECASLRFRSELDQDGQVDAVLDLLKIGHETRYKRTGRPANVRNQRSGRAVGRSDSAGPG